MGKKKRLSLLESPSTFNLNSKSKKSKKDRGKKSRNIKANSEWPGEQDETVDDLGNNDAVEDTTPVFVLPDWETACTSFFQQRRTIDFYNYIFLKREERRGVIEFKAARKIQAVFRGFLVRSNMDILKSSAIKIQAFVKGSLARKKYATLLREMAEIRHFNNINKAATKIQAAWRGYYSRKTKHNFKEFKKIQRKNKSLKKSIKKINQIEDALVNPSKRMSKILALLGSEDGSNSSGSRSSSSTGEYSSESSYSTLEGETPSTDPCAPKVHHMSNSRLEELYAYAAAKAAGIAWDGSPLPTRQIKEIEKLQLDSVDDLFPDFPNIDGLIRPDSIKVSSLKDAIRLLHRQMESREMQKLEKKHYLLRTAAQPGVYSDIYCNQLTEFEQQLKSVKFWKAPPTPPKTGRGARGKNKNKGAGDADVAVRAPPVLSTPIKETEEEDSATEEEYYDDEEYEGEEQEVQG